MRYGLMKLDQRLREVRQRGLLLWTSLMASAQDEQEAVSQETLRETRECLTLLDEARRDAVVTPAELKPIEQRLREMETEIDEGRVIA